MKKLEIELFRYDNVLFGRVLHMDESLRGVGVIAKDEAVQIRSWMYPDISDGILFINGENKVRDGEFMYQKYESVNEAIATGERYRELIDKINRGEDMQTTSLRVVKVI